jgi:hypothetical protein
VPGSALLALWHDVAPATRADFYAWHGREHIPSRLAVPGIERARRYRALAEGPQFLSAYDATGLDVLRGPELGALQAAPPTRSDLRGLAGFEFHERALCSRLISVGEASEATGGLLATVRYRIDSALRVDHAVRMREELLPRVAAAAEVAGAQLFELVERESPGEDPGRAGVDLMVWVEGWADKATLRQAAVRVGSDLGVEDATTRVYQLELMMTERAGPRR